VYLHKPVPDLNGWDIVFFLRGIPMMAALALRRMPARRNPVAIWVSGFSALFTWWTFLYAFAVLPWIYASPVAAQYTTTTICWLTFRAW